MIAQGGASGEVHLRRPGTRTLTLPCPFAEIAPLATTR
jgi:hypothetical protein